ncbi:MAG TPA: hypothetical protein VKW78_15760 [Terriglobales bacterium]|nr:hypothetical protein [Terriglobales bacterium]
MTWKQVEWFASVCLAVCCGISVAVVSPMYAASDSDATQVKSTVPVHYGYPSDWSARHLILGGNDADKALAKGQHDPRHVYNLVQRMLAVQNSNRVARRPRKAPPAVQVDWAVSLENGYVPANQFPAKFRFDVTKENCNSDFIVFGLTVTSGTQANLVGINNLYTGGSSPCNGGNPYVAFAYNTAVHGGNISTSPVLSSDGTKVAFVENAPTGSYFHVLVLPNPIPTPPAQSGNVLSPITPTICNNTFTSGCMTDVQISSAANTNSSPWVDYDAETAYVGTDDGVLHQIHPVFSGTNPVVDTDTVNWPVTVSTQSNSVLTGAVVDNNAGLIFVGDGYGYLYSVSLTNPAKTTNAQIAIGWVGHGPGTGILDPPIVINDPANPAIDQVFAFTGCSITLGDGGAVSQVPANFTSNTTPNSVDLGSASGVGDCTTGNVHGGTFDNTFWTSGSNGGHLIACGFVSGTGNAPLIPSNPKMYWLPFNRNHIVTNANQKTYTINSTIGDECSPLTEFYDGTTDRLFFGVGNSDGYVKTSTLTNKSISTPSTCTAGSPSSSCVTTPANLGGTSGIVIDNTLSATGGANIYFSTLAPGGSNGANCNVSGGAAKPYCAIKLTQNGLK